LKQIELSQNLLDEALNSIQSLRFYGRTEKRRAVLNKKYQNCLAVFQRFFSIPKIVLTTAMTLALFIVLKFSVYRIYFH
jgi:hypothetical protein